MERGGDGDGGGGGDGDENPNIENDIALKSNAIIITKSHGKGKKKYGGGCRFFCDS